MNHFRPKERHAVALAYFVLAALHTGEPVAAVAYLVLFGAALIAIHE